MSRIILMLDCAREVVLGHNRQPKQGHKSHFLRGGKMTTTLYLGFISAATSCLPPFKPFISGILDNYASAIRYSLLIGVDGSKAHVSLLPASGMQQDPGDLAEQILPIGIDCVKMTAFPHSCQDNHGV